MAANSSMKYTLHISSSNDRCLSTFNLPPQHEIALRTPREFQLSNNRSVTITAFDANHCPGAVMQVSPQFPRPRAYAYHPYRYLVEGSQGAVLHTGDFRAEPWFLGNILREPLLQKYLTVPTSWKDGETDSSSVGISETLEAIYLDTACLLGNSGLPPKVTQPRFSSKTFSNPSMLLRLGRRPISSL